MNKPVLNTEIENMILNYILLMYAFNSIMYSTTEIDQAYKIKLLNICYVIDDLGVQRMMSDIL